MNHLDMTTDILLQFFIAGLSIQLDRDDQMIFLFPLSKPLFTLGSVYSTN